MGPRPWAKEAKVQQQRGDKTTEPLARLLAEFRTLTHNAQSYRQGAGASGRGGDAAKNKIRKAEWECGCGTRNFTDRITCRSCRAAWNSKCVLHPASPPLSPLGKGGGRGGGQGKSPQPEAPRGPGAGGASQAAASPTSGPVTGASPAVPIASRIRMRQAMLTAARKQVVCEETNLEIQRHEKMLEALRAEEKAALPPDERLRSLWGSVKRRLCSGRSGSRWQPSPGS